MAKNCNTIYKNILILGSENSGKKSLTKVFSE